MTDWLEDPERTLVRIVENIGRVLGVDGREYDLVAGDVVTLPSTNAEPLLAKDGAVLVDEETSAKADRPATPEEAEAVAGAELPTDYPPASHPAGEDVPGHSWEYVDWIWAQAQARYEKANEKKNVDLLAAAMGEPEEQAKIASSTAGEPSTSPSSSSSNMSQEVGMAQSVLPLAHLDLDHRERRRAAKKRGVEWPSTEEARDKLFATTTEVMRHEDVAVVDSPTALGKSYLSATTPWASDHDLEAVTGGKPVVHLLPTKEARDTAIQYARDNGFTPPDSSGPTYGFFEGREEACPVCAGAHDPPADEEDREEDRTYLTVDGQPVSEFIAHACDHQGRAVSEPHAYAAEHNDQDVDLPCQADGECRLIEQWDVWRKYRDEFDVVFATHQFAHVPGLRAYTNVIVDEQPDFTVDMTKDRLTTAITAFLKAVDAPTKTWEGFVGLAMLENLKGSGDAGKEREQLKDAIETEVPLSAYREDPDLHTQAPAIARALFWSEERANNRIHGKAFHEPPRLDAHANDHDGWNRETVSIVMSDEFELLRIRSVPDFNACRSVVGMDAHPSMADWQLNVRRAISKKRVLEPEERRLWRRFERGLRVVQVGDATRPLASGDYWNEDHARALCEHLEERYNHRFRTALTAKAAGDSLERVMDGVGCVQPEVMTYGLEKSNNSFAHEGVGLVYGSIDPGDDYVLDHLAELGKEAEPERSETACTDCGGAGCHECDGTGHKRAHGREFVGPDADLAESVLAGVRENHVAQAAGRYARDADDPDSHATVFVATDAMPPGFADVQVPGVTWTYTATQDEIAEVFRQASSLLTLREVAEEVGCSKTAVEKFVKEGGREQYFQAFPEKGPNGATLYRETGLPHEGAVDFSTANGDVLDPYTFGLAIRDPSAAEFEVSSPTPAQSEPRPTIWPQDGGESVGGGPPDGPDGGPQEGGQ